MAEKIIYKQRLNTNSLKWDGYREVFHRDDILPLWVADMDFEVCKSITKAINKRASHTVFGYPVVDSNFYEAIMYWHERRYDAQLHKDWIIPLNGVVSAIFAVALMRCKVGDSVLVCSPVYGPFFSVPRSLGLHVVEEPLSFSGAGYEIDFERFEKTLASSKAKMFILCHPHNPIGRIWSDDELRTLDKICAKYDCMIVSDEIHADLYFDNRRHKPFYGVAEHPFISLFSPTKSFNLPGLNVAYAVIRDEKLRKEFQKLAQNMHITLPNIFGITALKSAYIEAESWLDSLLVKLDENRKVVDEFFANKKFAKFYKPQATYLGWIDFSQSGLTNNEIRHRLLDEAKVGLSGGDFFFGGKSTSFHRINFATSEKIVRKALLQIDTVFGATTKSKLS